jgi:tetratricopeptide (TPR) repeat protein
VIDAQLAAAAAQARAAFAAGTADAYDHVMLALEHSARGEYAQADALLERALALEPGNPATLTSLAIHYRRQGRNRDAVLACDDAIRHYPDYPDAWLERASILATGGSIDAARTSYARAAQLVPNNSVPHAGLASLAAREGDHDAARSHAHTALTLDPANSIATNALASAALGAGQADAAAALLEPLLARLPGPSLERSFAHGLLADARHRQRDHAAAFAQYQAANTDFAAIHAADAARHLDQTSFIEALITGFAATDAGDWHRAPGAQPIGAAARHIFLLGYPRSGTTLVENILASLPGVAALEERPTFAAVDHDHIAGDPAAIAAGLQRFAQADASSLERYRCAYWDSVTASGVPAHAPAFVDMDPMKGTRLPFIARMFPDARILLMRRDPRDVVWSCFRTSFAMSSQTLEYTSLDRTARHYDALMRLTEMAIERLPLTVHVVDYHRLVRDFDAETQAMCSFVGLVWSDKVRGFDRTAKARGVSTASVAQVGRGLYDGTRQWEPYAEFLEPVLPILQPWIEKFGYAD